jgi:hypothetical protein
MQQKTVKFAAAGLLVIISLLTQGCLNFSAARTQPAKVLPATFCTVKATAATSTGIQPQWKKVVTALKNDMKNISFTITIIGSSAKVSMKYFLKDKKIKGISSNGTVVYINISSGKLYSYSPKTKIAFQSSSTGLSDLFDYQKYMSAQYIGAQAVSGTRCDVFEASVNSLNDAVSKKLWTAMGTKSVKLYISQANGFFTKQEVFGKRNTTSVYSNVLLDKVTDADVTLPADAKINGKG